MNHHGIIPNGREIARTSRRNSATAIRDDGKRQDAFHLMLAMLRKSFYPCLSNIKQGQIMLASIVSAKWKTPLM